MINCTVAYLSQANLDVQWSSGRIRNIAGHPPSIVTEGRDG